ncbi:MAG: DUF333 domain-containing protein [Pseudomonadota bacterium]
MFSRLVFMALSALAGFSLGAAAQAAPNPAAVFCGESGGSYAIVAGADGQRGVCTLADGREVDAWDYFRAQHQAEGDGEGAPQLANPAATFCLAEGGRYEIVDGAEGQSGICQLPDGRTMDAWDYFREQHGETPSPAPDQG